MDDKKNSAKRDREQAEAIRDAALGNFNRDGSDDDEENTSKKTKGQPCGATEVLDLA